jgi:ketosteroid isomerase-like protein
VRRDELPPDSATALEQAIDFYNDAWNRHDVDDIASLHAPDFVFENHTAGERAVGADAIEHIAQIFRNWPDLTFRGRRLYVREALVVSEWTATATHPNGRILEWDGVDVFPGSANARVIGRAEVDAAVEREP